MTTPFTILAVDDHPNNLFTLETLLKHRLPDCRLIQASSGEEALMRVIEQSVHLILLDIQMPNMDGYETAQHLKMTSRTRDIPIVFLTAVFKSDEFIHRGYHVGAVDYLTKPLDDHLLINRIKLYRALQEREVALIQALDQLKRSSEASFQALFEGSMDAIILFDLEQGVVDCNARAVDLLGYDRKEQVLGLHLEHISPPTQPSGRTSDTLVPLYFHQAQQEGSAQFEWVCQHHHSGFITLDMLLSPITWRNRPMVQASLRDISLLKEHQKQLEFIAHYDVLTKLPNRVLLSDRLQQAMIQATHHQYSIAVVYLDLDGFKSINDHYGHNAGDELLIHIAKRMKSSLRDTDTLARIGGDEFIAILNELEHEQDGLPLLNQLLIAATSPIFAQQSTLSVSTSIGYTLFPQDNVDAEQLIRHADQAMYTAKQSGKNRYHRFDLHHDTHVKHQQQHFQDIKIALERNEFVLYYQPKVNMRTGVMMGAEALIRWQHPQKGLLPPGEFLPQIENSPISIELGHWVIDAALKQLQKWQQLGLGLSVSINIAACQLQSDDFIRSLSEHLSHYPDIPPHRLEVEILETSALSDLDEIARIISACHTLGVGFALDDFGTGYSSLTYLKHLPANILKIDQSFIRDMLIDPNDLAIVTGVIGLADAFHREVIAEGVETQAHGEQLLALGCELGQGYGIARPMPAHNIPKWTMPW